MKDFDPLQMFRMIAEAFYRFSNDRNEQRRFHTFTAVVLAIGVALLVWRIVR
jgi:hypothetical protein